MKNSISDIVNLPKLQGLMESFYEITGISSALLGVDGETIFAVGWQDFCTKFDRKHPQTKAVCRECDCFSDDLILVTPYLWHQCARGINYIIIPIIVDGVHMGNLLAGQLLFEEPKTEEFKNHITQYFRNLADHLAEIEITKNRLMESNLSAIRNFKKRVKSIIDNTPIALRVFSADGTAMYFNKAAEIFYNVKLAEIKGKKISELGFDLKTTELFENLMIQVQQNGWTSEPVEWCLTGDNGIVKYLYTTVLPIRFGHIKEIIYIDLDVTEHKRMESELALIEKMNLVGEMAAGLGHEVRNPMTTVRGFLQMLSTKEECQKHADYFIMMLNELDRANSIIAEFLSLAKNKPIKLESKDMNSIILSVAPLIQANAYSVSQNINIDLGQIPKIKIDEQEMKQLILNLACNGMDAMNSGGILTIKTYSEGEEVVLLVADEGCGISDDLIDKLGTPFYSTKENGTGLGLAVCYSIVARHKAQISLESGKKGTKFYIRFNITN